MVKEIPSYQCNKCGFTLVGEKNKSKVEQHENTPITGKCTSLDGLILRIGYHEDYYVFRRISEVNQDHKTLYSYATYDKKTLKENSIDDHKDTATSLIGLCLFYSHQENTYPRYNNLSQKEFKKITKELKETYPELYNETFEFKRILKHKGKTYDR